MMENTNKAAFINRQEELECVREYLSEEAKNALFIYGPKSSGKTTMLYKLVEELQQGKATKNKFNIRYYNLRKILIINYKDFLQTFFKLKVEGKGRKKSELEVNLKAFKISKETLKDIESKSIDPFEVLEKEIKKLNAKGIKPVIIIDELQALEGIYMNGQRELIKELFNFFVAMTKEAHLCHVIIGSSDGYFIERIYEESKLRKASKFLKVDYLNEEDTKYWLRNIEKESNITKYKLSEEQIEKMWYHFGGSCFEISAFLGDLLRHCKEGVVPTEDFEKELQDKMIMSRSMYVNYVDEERQKDLFVRMNNLVKEKRVFILDELYQKLKAEYKSAKELRKELNELVSRNYLSYDPVTGEYELQGRSMEIGLEMYVEKFIK